MNRTTNKLWLIAFTFILQFPIERALSQSKTQESQELYFAAIESYNEQFYSKAIHLLSQAENTGGGSNVYIQILRVKCHIQENDFISAKSELNKCYNYNVPNKLAEEIASLSDLILEGEKKTNTANSSQNKFEKLKATKTLGDEKAEANRRNSEDEKLWESAKSKNTINAYKGYKNSTLGVNHKHEADVKMEYLLWKKAIETNTIQGYWDYINTTDIPTSKKKHAYQAKKYLETKEYMGYKQKEKGLPKDITRYVNIREISVNNSTISAIPSKIDALTKLEELWLQRNNISKLPPSIGNLPNLKRLDLTGNKLTTLPESIGNLSRLTKLILINNNIQSLPRSLAKLSRLKYFSIDKSSYKIPEVKEVVKYLKSKNQHLIVEIYKNN